MLILCYHTADESLIDIVNRYWMSDENGKYIESSTSFLPLTGAKYASEQVKILANVATAFVTDSRCRFCRRPQKLKSRSTPVLKLNHDCEDCVKLIRDHESKIEEERLSVERNKLSELLQMTIVRNSSLVADYGSIDDDLAIIVLALSRTLGNRLFDISFTKKQCINFASGDSIGYISRLLQAGLITTSPEYSAAGAYVLKGDELCYYTDKVAYKFVPDRVINSDENIINILQNRPFNQGDVLKSLWIEYATGDCMAYLSNFSSLHGLETTADENDEIDKILRAALNVYSVANLWSIIWMAVKDAAALSTREYYNKRKAAGTLPGKLKRYLEDVSKGKRNIYNWDRRTDQPSGSLGEIFYEIWTIDEKTPGTELGRIFPTTQEHAELNELYINRKIVTETLLEAIEQDFAPEMLFVFANAIKEGKSLMEALQIAGGFVE